MPLPRRSGHEGAPLFTPVLRKTVNGRRKRHADGMKIVNAAGPVLNRRDTQRVEFEALPVLHPQQTVQYNVEVEASKAGDFRFRTELSSKSMPEPVVKIEPTNVR